MRHTRKGDLALSTNAIVVLIIAVIVLGLIITFITGGLTAVGRQFEGEFSKVPTPATPSAREPITQAGNLILAPGESFSWKILVFNTETDPLEDDDKVTITCLDGDVLPPSGNLNSFGQEVPSRSVSQVYEVTGSIADDAPSGLQVCQLSIGGMTRDITLDIRD
jgi:hypothetical protein